MGNYTAETYGETHADIYDSWHGQLEQATIETLADLASGGRVLELGIGTGRVAIPLAERGIEVHGIDASPTMVAKLHAKPGGQRIQVVIGDLASPAMDEEFSLVYVVFNTFFCLLTQKDQVQCFRNVAQRLTQEGVFLIEAFVPDLSMYPGGQCVRASRVGADQVSLDIMRHNSAEQYVAGQQITITEYGTKLYPIHIRYAWPSELDLMAQLAGLRLQSRWSNWRRDPFNSDSKSHISVYERAR
jgi:SAM-dependent methyltransferase